MNTGEQVGGGEVQPQSEPSEAMPYQCHICSGWFPTKQSLGGHVAKCAREHQGAQYLSRDKLREMQQEAKLKRMQAKKESKIKIGRPAKKKIGRPRKDATPEVAEPTQTSKRPYTFRHAKWKRTIEKAAKKIASDVVHGTQWISPPPPTGTITKELHQFQFCPCCGTDLRPYLAAATIKA